MALSMVHLLLARAWARRHPAYLDSPAFYLGAISPDAMHVRFHDDKSRKDEFHLGNWGSVHLERVHAYWREHFSPFDVGYGIHALTDGHWVPAVKRDFPEMVDPELDALIPALYYNDVYQTDFRLYAESPDRPRIFSLLSEAQPPSDHPLLTAGEIAAWRDGQFSFYQSPCPYRAPVRFVDVDYVSRFIAELSARLEDIMRRYFS